MREKRRTYRLIAAFVSASVAVAAFAALGGVGLAQTAIALVQYQYGNAAHGQYGKKVTICHKGKNTITVSVNALPAHLNHGDTVGPCQLAQQNDLTEQATANTKKPKKAKKKDAGSEAVVESEQATTGKSKKQKRRTADAVTSATQTAVEPKKSKPAKGKKSGPPSVESDTSTQSSVAPSSSPKPKKQKPAKSKKAAPDASPDSGVTASPPGHQKGNGNGGGDGRGRGNGGGNGNGNGKGRGRH